MSKLPRRFPFQFSLFVLAITATSLVCASQNIQKPYALLPESWARSAAIDPVLPIYPDEALHRAVGGVVRIRFETNSEGEVIRIKIRRGTDPLLTKAIVESVQRWKYKPSIGSDGLHVSVISRLTFHFVIVNGQGRVQMYDPGPRPQKDECLTCSNTRTKEILEWQDWKEVWSNGEVTAIRPTLN